MRELAGTRASVVAAGALRRSAAGLAAAHPLPARRLPWRELANRLRAFEVFCREVRAAAAARAGSGLVPSLVDLVEEALGRPSYETIWAVEGIAYGYAERQARRGREPRDWLAGDLAVLPAACKIALHCGLGLSLARRHLAAATGAAAPAPRRELVGHVAACRALGPAYAAVLLEALGFMARLRHPRQAGELAGELGRIDREAHACYWHGLGRALTFSPGWGAARPAAPWRAVRALAREAPAGEARDNALAGLAWGVAMVNLRHPQVLAELLRRHGSEIATAPGFAHGIGSALLVCHQQAPDDPHLAAWRRYQPAPAGGELAGLWQRQVSAPVEAALASGPRRARITAEPSGLFRMLAADDPATPMAPSLSQGLGISFLA